MPTELLFDLSRIDIHRDVFNQEEIRRCNPHRHEMELLNGIVHYEPAELVAVGYHQVPASPFWARGHIPGNPIFPGALMIETAAQLSSFCYRKRFGPKERFFGFGGIDKVRFRGMVRPGDRLYVICRDIVLNRRHSRFKVQGICNERIVFDGQITGVAIPLKMDASGTATASES